MDVQVTVHRGPFKDRPRIYQNVTSLTCDGSTWRLYFALLGRSAMVVLTDVASFESVPEWQQEEA